MAKRPPNWRIRKKKREDGESIWSAYVSGPLKKAWESIIVKGITGLLLLLSVPLYYNYFQNPKVNFPIVVEVIDFETEARIPNAEIYVQNTSFHFTTNADGIAETVIRVRKKQESIILTCTSGKHITQEKTIDVPEGRGPKPEFTTTFVLNSNDL